MDELIEKLKDKNYVRAFGLLSPEEQECFRKVGKGNCIVYDNFNWIPGMIGGIHFAGMTYAIKPDYKPEPEFVDLEIVNHSQVTVEQNWWLGVWKYSDLEEHEFLPHFFTHLHILPSLPNFAGFWIGSTNLFKIAYEEVATKIYQGHQVYARFRKKEDKDND